MFFTQKALVNVPVGSYTQIVTLAQIDQMIVAACKALIASQEG